MVNAVLNMFKVNNKDTRIVLINQFLSPAFCLCFALNGINFRGMLHHVCDVAYDENMCGPITTQNYIPERCYLSSC